MYGIDPRISGRPLDSWYRNAGYTVYHMPSAEWIRTGQALCGADISRPGFVYRPGVDRAPARPQCKSCLKRMGGA